MARTKGGGKVAGVREGFTMTEAEWLSVGGTPAPLEGHSRVVGEPTAWADGNGRTRVLTATFGGAVPALDNVVPAWEAIASAHHVHLLTIRWPDPHLPDFTAMRDYD